MESKKINQLATAMSPSATDLTIIGDPVSGVSKKATLQQISSLFGSAVSFYTNLAAFPATGTVDTLYCAKDTYKLYIWSGSAYVQTFPSQTLLDTYQLKSEKGVSNGYASLDSSGKVPISQLPSSIMEYKGMWNASTNTPTLANGTGDTGDVYICNVAGTVNFGAGAITFAVGDYVVYSGTIWQRSSGAVGTVTSVAVTETGDALTITGSPVTTSGTINIGFAGSAAQYVAGNGSLVTFPTIFDEARTLVTEVYNNTGATLTKGTVVYINGGQGNLPTITKAIATGDSTSAQTYGVVKSDITNMNNGYVVVIGRLGDLDTQAYSNGTQLYLSSTTAGAWTNTKQYAPAHLVYVGIVVRSHPTQGIVEIRIQNGFELDELHNVSAQTPSNNHGLFYNSSNSLWENKSIATALGYTPADDSLVVKLAGTQTISGTKTFTSTTTTSKIRVDNTLLSEGTTVAFKQYASGAIGETGYTSITAQGSNLFYINWGGTKSAILDSVNLTSDRTYTLPNADGTLALTSDIPSLSATAPISYSGGVISISQSTTSTNGYLSSTDWNTFNNKQNALTNPVTGTGTTNTLPKFTGTSAIGNSNITDTGSLITLGSNTYISSGGLGIGTSTITGYGIRINKNITGATSAFGVVVDGTIQSDVTTTTRIFGTQPSTVASAFTLSNLQHYVAGTTTIGAGATVTNQFGFSVLATAIGATNNYAFWSGLVAAANTWNLYMAGTANNYMAGSLGIGSTSLTGHTLRLSKNITGATTSYGIYQDGTIQSDVTVNARLFYTTPSTQAATFTLTNLSHYIADQGTFGAGSTVTNQYGFQVFASMIGATNNYGFRGAIPAGTNRWNLYMDGTASNYMAGSLGVGTNAPSAGVTSYSTNAATQFKAAGVAPAFTFSDTLTSPNYGCVFGLATANGHFVTGTAPGDMAIANQSTTAGAIVFGTGTTEKMRMTAAGTFSIGNTNSTYTLDVSGTGRFTGALTGTSANFSSGITTTSGYSTFFGLRLSGNDTGNTIYNGNASIGITADSGNRIFIGQVGSSTVGLNVSTTNGNVGIGTSSPSNLLHVSATSGILIKLQGSSTGNNTNSIQGVNGSGDIFELGIANAGYTNATYPAIQAKGAYLYGAITLGLIAENGPILFQTAAAERMRITSGGNVGIGTTTPNFAATGRTVLDINGTSNSMLCLSVSGTAGSYLYQASGNLNISNEVSGAIISYTGGSERMRLTSGGDLCIGSTTAISSRQELRIGGNSSGSRISMGINGTNYSALVTDSGGNVYIANEFNDSAIKLLMINYSNGVYLSQSATSWTANSDERLKDINGTIDNAVDKLKTLRAVNFSWKNDENKKEVLGLIAQDVEKVFPQVIDKNKLVNQKTDIKDETEYLGVRYVELVPVLVKAIQEQQAQIEELKSKIK